MQTTSQRKEIVFAQMEQAKMYAAFWMNSAIPTKHSIFGEFVLI